MKLFISDLLLATTRVMSGAMYCGPGGYTNDPDLPDRPDRSDLEFQKPS